MGKLGFVIWIKGEIHMKSFKKNLWLIIGTLIFVCIFTSNTKVQAAPKVYNNGQSTVEYNNKLYCISNGSSKKQIIRYDLKTRKKLVLRNLGSYYVNNMWIVQNKIYYECADGIVSMDLNGKKYKVVYNDKFSDYTIGMSQKRIYVTMDDYSNNVIRIKELNFSGKVLRERKIPSNSCAIIDGTVVCRVGSNSGSKGIGIYYGTMSRGVKKIGTVYDKNISDSEMLANIVGVYGDYVYGYVYWRPGTDLCIWGSLYQISLKTGKVRIMPESCLINNCQFVSGNIYLEGSNADKLLCYKLNKKTGSIQKCEYPSYGTLGAVNGQYIYFETNKPGNKGIIRYDMKTKKTKVMDSYCKTKKNFYYGSVDSPYSSVNYINGKLFYSIEDCSSGKMAGWRIMPDQTSKYYIDIKSKKKVKYHTEK